MLQFNGKRNGILRMELQRTGHRLSAVGRSQLHSGVHYHGHRDGSAGRQVQSRAHAVHLYAGLCGGHCATGIRDAVLAFSAAANVNGGWVSI